MMTLQSFPSAARSSDGARRATGVPLRFYKGTWGSSKRLTIAPPGPSLGKSTRCDLRGYSLPGSTIACAPRRATIEPHLSAHNAKQPREITMLCARNAERPAHFPFAPRGSTVSGAVTTATICFSW
jgi:hypothetical protein